MTDLTRRQENFVEAYLTSWNAAEAAREAGYSEKYADRQAYKLLQNPDIEDAIEARAGPVAKAVQAETNMRLKDLIGFWVRAVDLDVTEIMEQIPGTDRFRVTDLSALPRETRTLIKKIRQTKDGFEIEFVDKLKASELLGKAVGAFDGREEAEEPVPSGGDLVQVLTRHIQAADPSKVRVFLQLLRHPEFQALMTGRPVEEAPPPVDVDDVESVCDPSA